MEIEQPPDPLSAVPGPDEAELGVDGVILQTCLQPTLRGILLPAERRTVNIGDASNAGSNPGGVSGLTVIGFAVCVLLFIGALGRFWPYALNEDTTRFLSL